MKILQYTLGLPPYRRGGLPQYSTDLSEELTKQGEDVTVLYPGKMRLKDSSKLQFKPKKSDYSFKVVEMMNPLPVSLGLGINEAKPYFGKRDKRDIKNFLTTLAPDVIHLHTLMGLPLEFLEIAHEHNIKIVYTTHDFYGLCPKMLELNPKDLLQSRECSYDCMLCKDGPSLNKIKVMQSHFYEKMKNTSLMKKIRQNQKKSISVVDISSKELGTVSQAEAYDRYLLRKYYLKMFNLIDKFHFNSNVSADYIRNFLPSAPGKVISITHKGLQDNRKNNNHKFNKDKIRFTYIGPYDQKKGFYLLGDVFKELSKNYSNFEVNFYGDILEQPIFKESWAINHGIIPKEKMNDVYKNTDVLIQPSLWHETFGFTILEALSQGTPCIVSNNVGAKDLLPTSWIFRNKSELIDKLISIISDSSSLNNMQKEVNQLFLQNKFNNHVSKVIAEVYKS